MGRHYGAICKACGTAFEVSDGDIRNGELVRCDECGKSLYVPHEARRRAEHLGKLMPGHFEARRRISAGIVDEQYRIRDWTTSWLASLPFAAGMVRRARSRLAAYEAHAAELARAEEATLAKHPLPPISPPCACGGTFVRGARVRCPACRSTTHTRDPLVPEILSD